MLQIILFGLAAIFNAVMDTLEEGHFSKSIFKNLDPKFWYKYESWKYVRRIPIIDYPIDAWHICKSLMIFCLAGATAPSIEIFSNFWLNFIALGVMWNSIFSVFYSHILKKP